MSAPSVTRVDPDMECTREEEAKGCPQSPQPRFEELDNVGEPFLEAECDFERETRRAQPSHVEARDEDKICPRAPRRRLLELQVEPPALVLPEAEIGECPPAPRLPMAELLAEPPLLVLPLAYYGGDGFEVSEEVRSFQETVEDLASEWRQALDLESPHTNYFDLDSESWEEEEFVHLASADASPASSVHSPTAQLLAMDLDEIEPSTPPTTRLGSPRTKPDESQALQEPAVTFPLSS
eukprot:CAMPEP_0117046110 /NCGR_PEP_ID=MMETSP0472-20121206/31894_1 /TAXON_ID=693140 ORGANISM="Tiarina fusus, Strain LIS" /NCGR_SAMPLE_ID=MMETSP0472 /ASSEMBLY_ACC=CAM_ASM_000603 /LENGTH=237 /DNA_ID=CAMNT_0004758359 /DNA_START=15 /DNA_END=728 /DNA_ORIENTATION=-